MSNPLIHDCCALNPLADNIRSIKQRRISDGGIQNQTEIMSCLLETEMMEKKDVLFFSFWFPVRKEESKGMYQFNIPASTLLRQHGAS
jgi:hypothetical protein